MWRLRRSLLLAGVAAALGGFVPTLGTTGAGGEADAAVVPPDLAGVVWLCRPGQADDPCTAPLATTVVGPAGAVTLQSGRGRHLVALRLLLPLPDSQH